MYRLTPGEKEISKKIIDERFLCHRSLHMCFCCSSCEELFSFMLNFTSAKPKRDLTNGC
jgi:hypothetical protein